MTVLIKTLEEMLATPGVQLLPNGRLVCDESIRYSSEQKQKEICGKAIFCYRVNNTLVTQSHAWTWAVEPWMIKEVLVE